MQNKINGWNRPTERRTSELASFGFLPTRYIDMRMRRGAIDGSVWLDRGEACLGGVRDKKKRGSCAALLGEREREIFGPF